MKRTTLFCTALIAVLYGCASIETDNQQQSVQADGPDLVELTFNAVTGESNYTTRTAVSPDDNVSVYWYPDDQISVFDVNPEPSKNAAFQIDPSTYESSIVVPSPLGGPTVEIPNYPTEVSFTGLAPSSSTGYYAVYPYKDYSSYEGETAYGLYDSDSDNIPETLHLEWLGQSQNADNNTFDPQKAMMVAYTSGSSFNFKQVFAYFKFTTTFTCDEIVISGKNGEKLTADDIFVQMQGEPGAQVPVVIDQKSNPSADGAAHLLPKLGSDQIYAGTYLIAVLPQTLSKGFRIAFHNPNGKEFIFDPFRETSKQVTLSRAKILNIGTFDDDFITDVTEWQGSGTQASPYEIDNLVKLGLLAQRVNGQNDKYASKYYKLTADINCDGRVIPPIGNTEWNVFTGHFDGDGHTISNYIPGSSLHVTALFGYVRNAKIHNLNLLVKQINTNPNDSYSHAYSPLVGQSLRSSESDVLYITNCTVDEYGDSFIVHEGDNSAFYGGFVGWTMSDFEIRNCVNNCALILEGDITKELYYFHSYSVGGILGAVIDNDDEIHVKIHCCRNTGHLKMQVMGDGRLGGIVGFMEDNHVLSGNDVIPIITDCVNRGHLTINDNQADYTGETNVGGIVGRLDSDGYHSEDPYVVNSLNTGQLYANSSNVYIGGIIGYLYDDDTHVENCASTSNWLYTNLATGAKIGTMCGNKHGKFKYCRWVQDYLNSPIVYGATDGYEYATDCEEVSEVTSSMMNANVGKITPLLNRTYCQWTGSGETLDLNFSTGGPM